MDAPAISDEADALYRPLGGLGPWAAAAVDEGAWDGAVARLRALREEAPAWTDMVGHGALLATAHQSGALDSLYGAHPGVTRALLGAEASLIPVREADRAHVKANYEALVLARHCEISEASIRRIHEVACRPQLSHRVLVGSALQDHVLAGGDYKHHPNHVPTAAGTWVATAPVAQVRPEMAGLVRVARSGAFSTLHPVAQAAFLHHALTHVQPFADGNGRVARALAGGWLLRAATMPLLILEDDRAAYHDAVRGTPAALVGFVERKALAFVDLVVHLHDTHHGQGPALDRWCRRAETAQEVRAVLAAVIGDALDRYRRRPEPGWRVDLGGVAVAAGPEAVIRVPLEPGGVVEEVLRVDAHPIDGQEAVLLTADQAGLRLEIRPGTGWTAVEAALGGWLDRVVSVLALRVAAEVEE